MAIIAVVMGACSSMRKAAAPVEETATAWHTLYTPVRISLQKPAAFSASARATLVRDSLIHFSVRVFGMEVAQLRADADSAWLIDKYHKIYTSVPLAALARKHDISLGQVQDLILGQASLADIMPAAAEMVTVAAADYAATPAGPVAREVQISAQVHRRDVAASLRWDLDKARWNTAVDTRWTPPSNCKRIPPEELLKSLKGL